MIIVNLFGGPGVGKSTTAALTFGALKAAEVNCELVTEFAKDLVWESRTAISNQAYIFGKQLHRIERLRDQVAVVVTDGPILLCAHYGKSLGQNWVGFVQEQHARQDSMNYFLRRDPERWYNPAGRYQETVEEASTVDLEIEKLLLGVTHSQLLADNVFQTAELIATEVLAKLAEH